MIPILLNMLKMYLSHRLKWYIFYIFMEIYTLIQCINTQSFVESNIQSNPVHSSLDISDIEVAVIGSIMIDLVSYVQRLPFKGETIKGLSFEKNFGGKGANQAVQCARLGIKVFMCGKVGSDSDGNEYIQAFRNERVDTTYILQSHPINTHTGIATINVAMENGANTIIINPGANLEYGVSDVDKLEPMIRLAKVVVCQNEIPIESTKRALELAKQHSSISIFNPAPVDNSDIDKLDTIMELCDIVCPNEIELSLLTSLPTITDQDIEKAAKKLLDKGCKAVIVTLGGRGAYVARRKETNVEDTIDTSILESSLSSYSYFLPTIKTEVIDTVGAGDSFIGTLASNIARGCNLKLSVIRALHCASRSVTKKGAQKSYSYQQDLDDEYKPPSYDSNHKTKAELVKTLLQ